MARKFKKKRADPSPIASGSSLTNQGLPPSVLGLIKGNVIDISGASDFYRKKAEVATLLKEFVERRADYQYELKDPFDRFFLGSLGVFLRGHPTGPADALADALFLLGRQWAKTDYGQLAFASVPTDEFLHGQWKTASDWDSFVRTEACIGEVWWHNLGGDSKVHKWAGGSVPGDFELRVECGWETTKPPTLTIRIKGEPAEVLMKWWMTMNPNSPPENPLGNEALRKRTATVLDSLAGTLKMNLKLVRPERGRPRVDFGERAAYLLDHEKRNVAFIAKQLCPMPESATPSMRRQCFDRIRKAAKNYYKLLRSDYRTLTKLRLRQRIIRIQPNPKAVKSE